MQFDQEEEKEEGEEEGGLGASKVLVVPILASPCSTAVPTTSKKQFWNQQLAALGNHFGNTCDPAGIERDATVGLF